MRLKIQCDEESEKFCKIFLRTNRDLNVEGHQGLVFIKKKLFKIFRQIESYNTCMEH